MDNAPPEVNQHRHKISKIRYLIFTPPIYHLIYFHLNSPLIYTKILKFK